MIIYGQATGKTYLDSLLLGWGYSGNGRGLNNNAMESVIGIGAIPCGLWKVVRWEDEYEDKGPIVALLEPHGHNAHGRSGFLIHGDNTKMDHSASHGCIILNRANRQKIRDDGTTTLLVIT